MSFKAFELVPVIERVVASRSGSGERAKVVSVLFPNRLSRHSNPPVFSGSLPFFGAFSRSPGFFQNIPVFETIRKLMFKL